jgi:hypothetical protein
MSGATNAFNVPHSLALVPDSDMVCVADRENGRIQCFSVTDGTRKKIIKHPEFKTYVYAIAYQSIYIFAFYCELKITLVFEYRWLHVCSKWPNIFTWLRISSPRFHY